MTKRIKKSMKSVWWDPINILWVLISDMCLKYRNNFFYHVLFRRCKSTGSISDFYLISNFWRKKWRKCFMEQKRFLSMKIEKQDQQLKKKSFSYHQTIFVWFWSPFKIHIIKSLISFCYLFLHMKPIHWNCSWINKT